MKNKKLQFAVSALFLILIFALSANHYQNNTDQKLSFLAEKNAETFVRDYSPRYGNEKAKVYLVEFLDPQCESCRAFYPKVKSVLKEYDGKVKLVVRYAAFHEFSALAITALEATRRQNLYWESLEALFKNQPDWGGHHDPQPDKIFTILEGVGVNLEKLRVQMQDPEIARRLSQEALDLKTLNIRGTPTFFVNGKRLDGFGMDYLRGAVQKEVDRLY